MLTLSKAKKALEAAENAAKDLGEKVTIAIVDEHGTLVALTKMDGAFPISPKFAQMKAYTSSVLCIPSGSLAGYAEEGKPYYGLDAAFSHELIMIAGGLPIKEGEKVIGGIGVGGSYDVRDDEKCATAGLEALSADKVASISK